MRKIVFVTGLAIVFLMIPFLVHAEVYKWIDEKGTIHFTDDESKIPFFQAERLKVEIRKDIREETLSEPQKIIPGVKEERSREVLNGEEAWREEKMRSLMEQLEEAAAYYESAQKRFLENRRS